LWPEDVDCVHELWLELSGQLGSHLHHRDVVSVALRRLRQEIAGERRDEVLFDLDYEMHSEHATEVRSKETV
jgi:hypothetical protein